METQNTSHETEKSLTLEQIIGASQTETQLTKQQNGDKSPNNSPQRLNGETTWSHFKANADVFLMKQQREIRSSPDSLQEKLNKDMYEMNGQMNHENNNKEFLDIHPSKTLCADLEMNGNQDARLWDKTETESELYRHNTSGDFETQQSKRTFPIANGKIHSMSRNKHVSMVNGETVSPSSLKSTTGDLLEKTLSHYYPEHVSIAPQTNTSQVDQVTSNLEKQTSFSPTLTSGFPVSPLLKTPGASETEINGYSLCSNDEKKRPGLSKSSAPTQMERNGCLLLRKDSEGPEDPKCLGFKSNEDPYLKACSPIVSENDGKFSIQDCSSKQLSTSGSFGHDNKSEMVEKTFPDHPFQGTWTDVNFPVDSHHMWDYSQHQKVQQGQTRQSPMFSPSLQSQQFRKPNSSDENLKQNCLPPTTHLHNFTQESPQRSSGMHNHNSKHHIDQSLSKKHQIQEEMQSQGCVSSSPFYQQQDTSMDIHQISQDRTFLQAGQQSKGDSCGHAEGPATKKIKTEDNLEDIEVPLPAQIPAHPMQKPQENVQNCIQRSSKLPNYQHQHSLQNYVKPYPSSLKIAPQTHIKTEVQSDCLSSQGAQGDLQRYAALRMHLLQKQERQGSYQSCQGLEGSSLKEQDKVKLTKVTVKQEHSSAGCEQDQHRSILATMEQQLKLFQPLTAFERKTLSIKSPNKVKVEMAGAVTVLSTGLERNVKEQCKRHDFTPPKKKENSLQSFLESPMKLLDTPIKNLLDTPMKTQYEIPSCHCVEQISERDEGPYYTHLGTAPTVAGIRKIMEQRSGLTGPAIRIEKVVYTGKEGKSAQGCPIAKWVIRRASVDEKLLVLVRQRGGHSCETSCIVVVIMIWEGISSGLADSLYSELSGTLTKYGALTNRRCALNEERTCACQGLETEVCGASFSFGCSWSMYYNGCKFARSKIPRKFKLLGDDPKEEEKLEQQLQGLATLIGPKYKEMAPDAYSNQVEHERRAPDCRLGLKEGRPFSGVTACLDFCAHAHRDLHNMQGGSTVVCTLTREDNRDIGKIPEDEQLHVLPLYKASSTDEFGSEEAQMEKTKTGAIQVLSAFRRQVRKLAEPAKSCRQRKLDARKSASKSNNSSAAKTENQVKKQSTHEILGQKTSTTGPGNMPINLDIGHPPRQPQQQQAQPRAGEPYPRFHNSTGSFPTNPTKAANLNPQSSSPNGPYPSYLNRALTPNPVYTGYQCNGVPGPMDNYHPYYSPGMKHLDPYNPQRNPLYMQQKFNAPNHYGVSYPPQYGEVGLQVNDYSHMRPGMNPMEHFPGYSTNMSPDVFSSPSAHLDYVSASKNKQFEHYQNPQMFPPNPNTLNMQTDLGIHGTNGISQTFPHLSNDSFNPNPPPGLNTQAPSETPQPIEKEDVWSDSEHNFLDPEIGGVALAPSHGSIIIECAKRELHATTPLKKPDRNHPTRISLVFYQHKNLNEAKHGLSLWEAKMAEKAREKEEDAEKQGSESTPGKNKRVKREHPEPTELSEPPHKHFINALAGRSMSCTTNTYVSTSPYAFSKVTGPYNHFL